MVWLKACPRCDGDLYANCDLYGRYIACLQCGHQLNEAEEVLLRYSTSTWPEVTAGEEATGDKVPELARS